MVENIDELVNDLNKSYKKVIIRKASELPPLRTFPFRIPALDLDLGGGALWGRTTILAGAKGSCKTSSAYSLGGHANSKGIPVYWFDLEKAFDPDRAKVFGMIPDLTYVIRGELTAENIYSIVRDTIRYVKTLEDSRAIFIVDSIAGMIVEKLMDEDAASSQFGGSAKVINQGVAVWQIVLGDNQILLLINQLRTKMTMYGDPNMMPGGMAQEYWSSATIWAREGDSLKNGTVTYGQEMRWTIKKSRGSNPKELGVIEYDYQTGFNREKSLVAVAIELEILQKSSSWFVLPSGEKIQGENAFVERLQQDRPFMDNLEGLVYSKMPVQNWNGLNG